MVRVSGQRGVPVTTVDGQVVVGYDRARLDGLLAQARRPRLGAAIGDASEQARLGRTMAVHGAYIGRVAPGGAAERAGLQPGDVVGAVANRPISTAADLEAIVPRLPPGRDVPITYVRDGERRTAALRILGLPAAGLWPLTTTGRHLPCSTGARH
jgi:S1-C subfamily serine protease